MRLNYLKLTLRHKWFVFRAGLKLGVSVWRLLMHDVSKFSRAEYTHYQRWFFEDKNDPEGFAKAWIHHQNANAHHWEYWITRSSHAIGTAGPAGAKPHPMPEGAVREMVCLTGDTKIALLSGEDVPIKKLVEKKEFYVYARDLQTGEIVPARAHSCKKTKVNAEILKITLDNGQIIKCTNDHPFLLKSLRCKPAGELLVGDSLSPLYREVDENGYEKVLQKDGWQHTHRMTYNWKYGGKIKKKPVAHHKDFNKRNNSPYNILACHPHEHWKYHSKRTKKMIEMGNIPWKDPNFIKKHRKYMKGLAIQGKHPSQSVEAKRRYSKQMTEINNTKYAMGEHVSQQDWYLEMLVNRNKSITQRNAASKNAKKVCKRINSIPQVNLRQQLGKCNKIISAMTKEGLNITEENYEVVRKKFPRGFPTYKWYITNNRNHMVVLTEESFKKEDVYNFTVDLHKNYALSSGVFVHNCDWMGASLAYTDKPDIQEWVDKNWHKMNLHEDTSKCLDKVLKEQGWNWPGE